LSRIPNALAVEVANDLPPQPNGERRVRIVGGQGLQQLEGTVNGLGGTFDAGPDDHERWRLSAVLPL
jgi:hypothetical protein